MTNPFESKNNVFQNLFVLEAANNHWGDVKRGKKIIQEFGNVVRFNNVRAAIKFQFRDVDNFIHEEYKGNQEIRYIKKTEQTKMTSVKYQELVNAVLKVGCIPMATPFDENSVDLCVDLNLPILKIASSDINDWPLIEKVTSTKLPTIISSGGASEKSLDDVVSYFEKRNIPLAINHCVSLYPTSDEQLELNQIEYLKNRYPNHVIGFSSHEFTSWDASMYISYAKGARTWERHIDIDYESVPVSPYCSLPEQIDFWFKSFHRAVEMSGGNASQKRLITRQEIEYLDALVRGIYAKKLIPKGHKIESSNFSDYFKLAVPLRKGQLSTREVINGLEIINEVEVNRPLKIEDVSGPYNENESLRSQIQNRGV